MNRRIPNGTYGGVRGRELITLSYSIPQTWTVVAHSNVSKIGRLLREGTSMEDKIPGYPLFPETNRLDKVMEDDISTDRYTQYYYDASSNMIRMYTGLFAPLTIQGLDNVVTNGDSNYSVKKFEYNSQGKRTKVIDSLNQMESYTYDLSGNLNNKIDRNGNTASLTYDGLNRIKDSIVTGVVPEASTQQHYSYALTGNLVGMSNNNSISNYQYDDLGRLVKEITDDVTKEYTYDADGLRKSFQVKLSSGVVILNQTYEYNKLGQLFKVFVDGQLLVTYEYDLNGNITKVSQANGSVSNMTYNRANAIKSVTNSAGATTLSQFSYEYNLDGSISTITDPTGINKYGYDNGGRVNKTIDPNNKNTFYFYDDSGNRSMKIESDGTSWNTTYQYDKNDRMVKGTQENTNKYIYDPNGNLKVATKESISPIDVSKVPDKELLSDESPQSDITLYNYDGLNQLTTVDQGGVKASYAYNAAGLRVQKNVGANLSKQVWDGQEMVAEFSGASNTQTTYARGHNLIFSNNNQNQKTFYQYNGHGDTDRLTNASGAVIKSYTYDLFGSEQNPDLNDTNPFRYSGEYFDKETGSYYLRARYYNPSYGRFITEDSYEGSITNPLSLNLYTYVSNNPLIYIDPLGHDAIVINAKDSAIGFGHTSALVEDNRGDWYYYYWGDEAVAFIKAPNKVLENLGKLNEWLDSIDPDGKYSPKYTGSVYIEGDFNESVKYFSIITGTYDEKYKDGIIFNPNEDYDVLMCNCDQTTIAGLSKGTLSIGVSFSDYYKGDGRIPNGTFSNMKHKFFNSAYTHDQYEASLLRHYNNYLDIVKNTSRKKGKWHNANRMLPKLNDFIVH
jgi:RHS repeat-associated protein